MPGIVSRGYSEGCDPSAVGDDGRPGILRVKRQGIVPDLDIVLQGDGVRLNLRGSTFVSGKDVTSVTFASVPDIPLRSFELSIPEGKYSALGTDKDLCKQKLAMPTAVTGQNGVVVHTSVKVGVTGCPKPLKTASRKKRKGR